MYVSAGANEYHHLTLQNIRDFKDKKEPFLMLECKGKIMKRKAGSITGFITIPYEIKVRVRGQLISYVENELKINDNIFVIGRSDMFRGRSNSLRGIVAECIYREDWMTYYPRGNCTRPMDVEDDI